MRQIDHQAWARWPNFRPWEFLCRHCGAAGIDPLVVDACQEVRNLADAPVYIRSGYRCELHNGAVGGTPRSQHVHGLAADMVIVGLSVADMYRVIEEVQAFDRGGIGIYPQEGFVHGDCRKQDVRWGRLDGVYVPIEEAWNWMQQRRITA